MKEPLAAVRLFVEMNRTDGNDSFSLMTNFPKKVFSDDDYDKPLELLSEYYSISRAAFNFFWSNLIIYLSSYMYGIKYWSIALKCFHFQI